jgi:hypothetical protein
VSEAPQVAVTLGEPRRELVSVPQICPICWRIVIAYTHAREGRADTSESASSATRWRRLGGAAVLATGADVADFVLVISVRGERWSCAAAADRRRRFFLVISVRGERWSSGDRRRWCGRAAPGELSAVQQLRGHRQQIGKSAALTVGRHDLARATAALGKISGIWPR